MAQTQISQAITRPWWESVVQGALAVTLGIFISVRPLGLPTALAVVTIIGALVKVSSVSSTCLILVRRDRP